MNSSLFLSPLIIYQMPLKSKLSKQHLKCHSETIYLSKGTQLSSAKERAWFGNTISSFDLNYLPLTTTPLLLHYYFFVLSLLYIYSTLVFSVIILYVIQSTTTHSIPLVSGNCLCE